MSIPPLTIFLSLFLQFRPTSAGHCYSISGQDACESNAGGSPCSFCNGMCQMASDGCEVLTEQPGEDFFEDASDLLAVNPVQLNYGVSVTDTNGNGKLEFVVAGFGVANQAFEWDGAAYVDVASDVIADSASKAIGVAACDVDGDGHEELYILNTDSYSGTTSTSDRLIAHDQTMGGHVELFGLAANAGAANYVAGRSCACVDRTGDGRFGVMVANYGGPMRLFEAEADGVTLRDVAPDAGVDLTTGGRALVSGPIVSAHMDIFANNEGYGRRRLQPEPTAEGTAAEEAGGRAGRRLSHRDNYFFVNQGDGSFSNQAGVLGLLDDDNTGRGARRVCRRASAPRRRARRHHPQCRRAAGPPRAKRAATTPTTPSAAGARRRRDGAARPQRRWADRHCLRQLAHVGGDDPAPPLRAAA